MATIPWVLLNYTYNTINATGSFVRDLGNLALQSKVTWTPNNVPFPVVAALNYTQYVEIEWEILRFGYGRESGSAMFYFAATILLIHAVLAIAHIFEVWARQWKTNRLGIMGEMIALAVNSLPTEKLYGTSAGVKRPPTWQQIVQFREVDRTRLTLHFGDANVVGKPALGRKFK